MFRKAVDSSRINSVGWENNILEVEFKDGAIYHYFDFSQSEYNSFIKSPSLGSEISKLDKFHKYRRIN